MTRRFHLHQAYRSRPVLDGLVSLATLVLGLLGLTELRSLWAAVDPWLRLAVGR